MFNAIRLLQRKLFVKFSFKFNRSIVNRRIVSTFCLFPSDLRQSLCRLGMPGTLNVITKFIWKLIRVRFNLYLWNRLHESWMRRFVFWILQCINRWIIFFRVLFIYSLDWNQSTFLLQVFNKSSWRTLLIIRIVWIRSSLQTLANYFTFLFSFRLKNGLDLIP